MARGSGAGWLPPTGLCAFLGQHLLAGEQPVWLSLTFLTWDGLGPVLAAFFAPGHDLADSLLRLPGRLGYWLYPIHLVVLILIRLMTGTGFDVLVRGF